MEMPYSFEVPMQLGQKRRSLPRSLLAGPIIEGFHDNIEPAFPDAMQPFNLTGMTPRRPDLEPPEPVAPTAAKSDPQSQSPATTFDDTEECKVMAIDDANVFAVSETAVIKKAKTAMDQFQTRDPAALARYTK
ncbi:MAG: hypothetical protein Q9187_008152 [Circinaria calcarea]